jgi:hypothetical protein
MPTPKGPLPRGDSAKLAKQQRLTSVQAQLMQLQELLHNVPKGQKPELQQKQEELVHELYTLNPDYKGYLDPNYDPDDNPFAEQPNEFWVGDNPDVWIEKPAKKQPKQKR